MVKISSVPSWFMAYPVELHQHKNIFIANIPSNILLHGMFAPPLYQNTTAAVLIKMEMQTLLKVKINNCHTKQCNK